MQGGREGVRVVEEEGRGGMRERGKREGGEGWEEEEKGREGVGERENPHIPCIDVVRADLLKHQLQLDTR